MAELGNISDHHQHKVALNILYYGSGEHKENTQAHLPSSCLTEKSNKKRHLKGQKLTLLTADLTMKHL